jgi:hypothetical protein
MAILKNTTIVQPTAITLPTGTTAQRPAGPQPGMARYNTTLQTVEIYNGNAWVNPNTGYSVTLGDTASEPALSARELVQAGRTTNGLYWIQTPNGGIKQVYCDLTTPDAEGDKGWMLVAQWDTPADWTFKSTTTANTITSSGINAASSNFGDFYINKFRVQVATSISNSATNSVADWYYHWNDAIPWKMVWSPNPGVFQYYLSGGSNPNVQRCCIRPFNHSYNMRWRYINPRHRFNNISDYGYQNTLNSGFTGNVGTNSTASSLGFADYWKALTTPGRGFGAYNLSYANSFEASSGPTVDGTLAIPSFNANTDTSGQDVDSNIGTKIGRDDDTVWNAAMSSLSRGGEGNNNAISGASHDMWWWIK